MNRKYSFQELIKKCPVCGYEWLARKPDPIRCPNATCQTKLKQEAKA